MLHTTKTSHGFKIRNLHGFFTGICVGIAVTISIVYLGGIAIHQPCEEKYRKGVDSCLQINVTNPANNEAGDEKVNYFDVFPPDEYKPENIHRGETDLSDAIKVRIRILCFVATQPKNHKTKAAAVLATWGKRCNVFYFVSTQEVIFGNDDSNSTGGNLTHAETVVYRARESRQILWAKTVTGFQYAYDNYFDEADWFVKADDDTYIILENLRLLLLDKDPSLPVYYGCKFKALLKSGFMSGGAGYVLSKEALRRFIEDKGSPVDHCHLVNSEPEDVNMGKCMNSVGVTAGDSRDWVGQQRFFALAPVSLINKGHIDNGGWYWNYMWYPHEVNVECCSDSVISFHYITVDMLWVIEYFVYHAHPFGIHPKLTGANVKNKIETYLKQMKQCNITKNEKYMKNTTAKPV